MLKYLSILFFMPLTCFWLDKNEVDLYIKNKCFSHTRANFIEYENYINKNRCSCILQAQYRFETWHLKFLRNNNLFNFKSNKIKKEWKNISWISENWYLIFENTFNSVDFAVNRYYNFDYNRNTREIVKVFTWNYNENYINYIINFKNN